jgi:hypothetical protein
VPKCEWLVYGIFFRNGVIPISDEMCCVQELQGLDKGIHTEVEQLKTVRPPSVNPSSFYLVSRYPSEIPGDMKELKEIRSAIQEEKGTLLPTHSKNSDMVG